MQGTNNSTEAIEQQTSKTVDTIDTIKQIQAVPAQNIELQCFAFQNNQPTLCIKGREERCKNVCPKKHCKAKLF